MDTVIGMPLDRVDGRAKVTGTARYAADANPARVAHAVMVGSPIARGRLVRLDVAKAERSPGVLALVTPSNAPRLRPIPPDLVPLQGKAGQNNLLPLQDTRIHHEGQPVAVVVAETLEEAVYAASLIEARYETLPPTIDLGARLETAHAPQDALKLGKTKARGDVAAGLAAAAARVERTYETPVEHHNPIELHATVAQWDSPDRLTVQDATQGVGSTATILSVVLGLPPENVRVVCPYLGGGFGSKGFTWPHTMLAAMAAQQAGRPVKLVLARGQMFTGVGHRPRTHQTVALGADAQGRLTAMRHDSVNGTASFEDFAEPCGSLTGMLYACPNVSVSHRVVPLDQPMPTITRAPGEASGSFALESAMDELAHSLRVDPIELRLRNHAEVDPETGHPWSSKSLKKCYARGAERFGWSRRDPRPGSMRDGAGHLIGWGMATASYPAYGATASARVRVLADGGAIGESGTQDIGTGTYTVMTQVVADALGLRPERVRFALGDTALPRAPSSGGSRTTAVVGSAVRRAADAARGQLVGLAVRDQTSPLFGLGVDDVVAEDDALRARSDAGRRDAYGDVLRRAGLPEVEALAEWKPGDERERFGMHAFGAHFCEVRVEPATGLVRVQRFVGAFGAGRILNEKTARSQLVGGIVWGISMALHEHALTDPNTGRYANAGLADYLLPVNADIPVIDAFFVEEHDPHVNPLGAKGVGEIGIVGSAAAVANAVFHATGRRVRALPITPETLL